MPQGLRALPPPALLHQKAVCTQTSVGCQGSPDLPAYEISPEDCSPESHPLWTQVSHPVDRTMKPAPSRLSLGLRAQPPGVQAHTSSTPPCPLGTPKGP